MRRQAPLTHIAILAVFIINSLGIIPAQAQELRLPAPGVMVHLSPPYNPPVLKGIKVHPDNPFRFEFILDKGDPVKSPKGDHGAGSSQAVAMTQWNKANEEQELKQEANKLIKYFLASITTPEKDLWVNLSPYEKDRIIPQSFGLTEMGRDLLAQDYMLKQITASLIYPEDEIGRKFWKRIYEEASRRYGTTNIPVNTFNKVWIVPEKAVVYENMNPAKPTRGHVPDKNNKNVSPSTLPSEKALNVRASQGNPPTNNEAVAYVVESKLKVMLEEDYVALSHQRGRAESRATTRELSLQKHSPTDPPMADQGVGVNPKPQKESNSLGSQIIREIVIPELSKEVNENKNFAQLRQVYNSLILATWYKKKIKDSILAKVYADRNKIAGIGYQNKLETRNSKSPGLSARTGETNSKKLMIKRPKRLGHSDFEHLNLVSSLEFRASKLGPQEIYNNYLKAFKKGVYNYIKEEADPITQQPIPRKYFSGGVTYFGMDQMMAATDDDGLIGRNLLSLNQTLVEAEINTLNELSGAGQGLASERGGDKQRQVKLLYDNFREKVKAGDHQAIIQFKARLNGILNSIRDELKNKKRKLNFDEITDSIIEQEMRLAVIPFLEQKLRDGRITKDQFDNLKAQGPSNLKRNRADEMSGDLQVMESLGLNYRSFGSRVKSIKNAIDVLMMFQEFTQIKGLAGFIKNLDGDLYNQYVAEVFSITNMAPTFIDAVNMPYSEYRFNLWGEFDENYKDAWEYLRSSPKVTEIIPLDVFEDFEAQTASYSIDSIFRMNERDKGIYQLFWLASINNRLRLELTPMLITMGFLYLEHTSHLRGYLMGLSSEEIILIEGFNIPGLIEIIKDAQESKEGWTGFEKETIKDAFFKMGFFLASSQDIDKQRVGVVILSMFNWEFLRPRISFEQQIELERPAQTMLEEGIAESYAAEMLANLGNLGLHVLLDNLKPEQKNDTLIFNAIHRGYYRSGLLKGQSLGIEQTVAARLMELTSSGSREAIALLGQMGRHIRGADNFLINLYMKSESMSEKERIVSALGGVASTKAVDFINKLLAEAIQKKDYYEADEYIQALHKAGPSAAIDVSNIVEEYRIVKEHKFEGGRGDNYYKSIFHALVNSGTNDPSVLPILFDSAREMRNARQEYSREFMNAISRFGVEIIPFIVELKERSDPYLYRTSESLDQLIVRLGRQALPFLKGKIFGLEPDEQNPTILEFIGLASKNEIYVMAGRSEFLDVKEELIKIAQATTNNNIRSAAIRVLCELGLSLPEEFLTWAKGQLQDKRNEAYVRVACARLFIKYTETYDWFLPLFVSLLGDQTEEGDVRNKLHGVVFDLEAREIRQLERIYKQSPNPNVRMKVIGAFGVNDIDLLIMKTVAEAAQNDSNKEVREEAVYVLRRNPKSELTLPTLKLVIRNDKDEEVQIKALNALKEINLKDAVPIAMEIIRTNSGKRSLRMSAIDVISEDSKNPLSMTRKESLDVVVDLVKNDKDVNVRMEIISHFLRNLNNDKIISTLDHIVQNDINADVRAAAIRALGKTETSESVRVIERCIRSDSDESVRMAAIGVLRNMKFLGGVSNLVKMAKDINEQMSVRAAIIRDLCQSNRNQVIEMMRDEEMLQIVLGVIDLNFVIEAIQACVSNPTMFNQEYRDKLVRMLQRVYPSTLEIEGKAVSHKEFVDLIFKNRKFLIPGYLSTFLSFQFHKNDYRNAFMNGYDFNPAVAQRWSYDSVERMSLDEMWNQSEGTSGHIAFHGIHKDEQGQMLLEEAILRSGYLISREVLESVNERNLLTAAINGNRVRPLGRTGYVHFSLIGAAVNESIGVAYPVEVLLENQAYFRDPLNEGAGDFPVRGFSKDVEHRSHRIPLNAGTLLIPNSLKQQFEELMSRLPEGHRPNKIFYYDGKMPSEGLEQLKQRYHLEKKKPVLSKRPLVVDEVRNPWSSEPIKLMAIKGDHFNGLPKYRALPYLLRYDHPVNNDTIPGEVLIPVIDLSNQLVKSVEVALAQENISLRDPLQHPVEDTGSAVRGTYNERFKGLPDDFDLMVYVERLPSPEVVDRLTNHIKEDLVQNGILKKALGSDVNYQLKIDTRPEINEGRVLSTIKVFRNTEENIPILSIDVNIYANDASNDGPRYQKMFRSQMNSLLSGLSDSEKAEGEQFVLSTIRTLKMRFKDEGLYKRWEGGLRGVGVEQLVMQMRNRKDAQHRPLPARSLDDIKENYSLLAVYQWIQDVGFINDVYQNKDSAAQNLNLTDTGSPDRNLANGLQEETWKRILAFAIDALAAFKSESSQDVGMVTTQEMQVDSGVVRKGGIDLTSANMNLETQNGGAEIKFHIDPATLAQLENAPGFEPRIVNMSPMDDLKGFLAIHDQAPQPAMAGV